jgi:hypothetical protein
MYPITVEFVENTDGSWNMNIDAETRGNMALDIGVDSIEKCVISADFTEIIMHYTLNGEAKTSTFTK